MANLPPPNNDPNVPEVEHAPAPEHAPIAPNHAPIQPNDYLADDDEDPKEEPEEEEEPIPEQASAASARLDNEDGEDFRDCTAGDYVGEPAVVTRLGSRGESCEYLISYILWMDESSLYEEETQGTIFPVGTQ
ncbi:hypothetical protein Tco_1408968 [Tanacetum coccineum]